MDESAQQSGSPFVEDSTLDFAQLAEQTRPILQGYLVSRGVSAEDARDYIQSAYTKIWEHRDQLRFASTPEWFSYAKRVADRLLIDSHRKLKGVALVTLPDEQVTAGANDNFIEAINTAIETRTITTAADSLWLGEPPNGQAIRLVLAKMLWIDNTPTGDVLVVARKLHNAPNTTETLHEMVRHPAVIRSLAFEILAPEPSVLAARLCGCSTERIRQVIASPAPIAELSIAEVQIILSKAYWFEHNAATVAKASELLSEEKILAAIDRIGTRLPFIEEVCNLIDRIGDHDVLQTAFSTPGLWKRVVFHYSICGMPHGDIHKWIGPVASSVGFKLEPMTIHAWVSNRRLIKELTVYLNREREEYIYG